MCVMFLNTFVPDSGGDYFGENKELTYQNLIRAFKATISAKVTIRSRSEQ